MELTFADLVHFTRSGKPRYHYFMLPKDGRLVTVDMTIIRDTWSNDVVRADLAVWPARLWGDKLRAALYVWGSINKVPVSVTFTKPYNEMKVWVG